MGFARRAADRDRSGQDLNRRRSTGNPLSTRLLGSKSHSGCPWLGDLQMLSNIRIIALRAALLLVVLAPLTMALSACDTTEGFGKDVSHTGDAITNSARDA